MTRAAQSLFPSAVFGIDFGPASLAAARWAVANIAQRPHATLTHIVPARESRAGNDGDVAADPESRRLLPALTGGLGGFAATLNVANVRTVVRVGSPSKWLSTIANDGEASLLVLGRRNDSKRKGLGEPNVVERLARRARSSVLVVPEGSAQPLEHVVAAVDNSPFARHVLRVARWIALLHRRPLTILHVLPPFAGSYDRVIRTARRMLISVRTSPNEPSHLRAAGPPRTAAWLAELVASQSIGDLETTELAIGDPAREIAAAAVSRGSALVVVGQRGADEAPAGSLGSVARELLTRAPVPVMAVSDLVARAPEDAEAVGDAADVLHGAHV